VKRKRHGAIGIKQVIRHEWMEKTVNLLLAGLETKSIRQELHAYLATRRGDGDQGQRSERTRRFVVDILMRSWVSPEEDLAAFRSGSLAFLRQHPSRSLAVDWGIISAAYPFWFNVARQMGRLLALQKQVTQAQIIHRMKEQYGDRQTVSRSCQYVIRSYVAWGIIRDAEGKGCYEKAPPIPIIEPGLALLLFESALLASPGARSTLGELLNNPAFFPFDLPGVGSELVTQHSARIDLVYSGLNDTLLQLKA
jgi:hypothetical protein